MKAIPFTIAFTICSLALAIPATTQAKGKPEPGAAGPRAAAVVPDPAVREALAEALAGPDGEYAAFAAYRAIIEKHGKVLPYANIMQAESRHITALQGQFQKFGIPVPENTYLGKVKAPDDLGAIARLGVTAEKENVAMYDRLMAKVKYHPDLVRVFANLRRASRENHLPAFEAAAKGDGTGCRGFAQGCGVGCGRGLGRGYGRGARGSQ